MNTKHAYGLTVALFAAAGLAACNQSNSPLSAVSGTQSVELKTTDMVEGSAMRPATIIEFASMTLPALRGLPEGRHSASEEGLYRHKSTVRARVPGVSARRRGAHGIGGRALFVDIVLLPEAE